MRVKNKNIKIFLATTIFLIGGVFLFFDFASAQTSRQLDVAAYITDKNNRELTNGKYDVRFSVYSQEALIWQETQNVEIKNGMLSAYLGAVTPLPDSLKFDSEEYSLGIKIGNDNEMTPRKKIGAVPMAVNSRYLQGKTIGTGKGDIPEIGNNGKLNKKIIPNLGKLGTITSGTWEADSIDDSYVSALASASQGDVLYHNGSRWTNLSAGSSGQYLETLGTGANPRWSAVDGNGVSITGAYDYLTLSGQEISLGQIDLTTDVSGILPAVRGGTGLNTSASTGIATISSGAWSVASQLGISLGGTNATIIGSAGSIAYSTGTAYAFSAAGTTGQVLLSGGTGSPTWGTVSGGVIAADSLDFTELADSMTLDANLAIASSASNYSINIDSNTLFVDTANNRVGIGTATPSSALEVNGSITLGTIVSGTWNGTAIGAQYGGTGINTSASTGVPTISAGTWSIASSLGVTLGGTGTTTQFTQGSVAFAGASGVYSQDNANFFWDDTNNRLGIGTATPASALDVYGSIYINGTNGISYPATDTTAGASIAIGSGALANQPASAAYSNTAIGYQTLNSASMTTAAIDNTAVGYKSLKSHTSGYGNTAVGSLSLQNNTTGNQSTAVGYSALSNMVGLQNTAVGYQAMMSHTSGYFNVALGVSAFGSGASGNYNVAIGASSLSMTTGSQNTALGRSAGSRITSGSSNVVIGDSVATVNYITGSSNILIGNSSAVDTPNGSTSYNLNVGNLLQGDMTNSTATYNKTLYLQSVVSGVNYTQASGAATGSGPTISAQGSDTNINLNFAPKGAGDVIISSGNLGIGDTTPAAALTVGNGDLFQVNSSGVVAAGTWNGTAIGAAYGGTGLNTSASTGVPTISAGTWSIASSLGVTLGGTGTATQFTQGSVAFAGASGVYSQDNANFFWDDTNNRLGIGTATPATQLHISGTSNKIRLAYDGSNYTDFSVGSDGSLTVDPTGSGNSVVTIGDGTAVDQNALFDGDTVDYYVGQDDTDNYFKIGSGTTVGTNAFLTINSNGNVGIGDTSPAAALTVGNGDLFQVNSSGVVAAGTWNGTAIGAQYGGTGINTSASTGVPTISAGTWSIASSLGVTLGGTGTTTQFTQGSVAFAGASGVYTQDNANFFWDDTNNRLGIGTATPATRLAVQGTSATDLPTYGSELLTSAGWTVNAGWTESPDDTFAHTGGGGTATLTHSATITSGVKYQFSWTVTGRTAGSVSISVGGQASGTQTSTGSFGPTTSSTAAFTITPTTDFDGTISLTSLKQITAVSTAIASLSDSTGTNRFEIRAGTGADNTFVGLNAGAYNTTGYSNSATGYQALYSNTTGNYSTATGYQALYSNTTGNSNTAIGRSALYTNTTGYYNTAIGFYALLSNTTGYNNVAIGQGAVRSNSSGANNIGVGFEALYASTTGHYNAAIGRSALYANTTGGSNIAFGYEAGRYQADGATALTDPEVSVYLGTGTRGFSNADSNSIVIGYNAIGIGANTVVLGNDSITTTALKGNVGIGTTTPSGRLHAYVSNSAVTASNYDGYFENLATNATTDAINKYGIYVTSTGTFTGGAGTATNNYGIYLATTSGGDNNYQIYDQSGAYLSTAGTWTNAPSYRRYKDNYSGTESYLDRLMTLDVFEWQYKNETVDGMNRYANDPTRHTSPFLDDFYNVFHLGTDKGVNVQDMAGVALASVKELNTRFIAQKDLQTGVDAGQRTLLDSITLKTDQNISTVTELQLSIDTQLGVIETALTDFQAQSASLKSQSDSLMLQANNFENRLKQTEDLAVILQQQIADLQAMTNQDLSLAQLEANTTDISFLKTLLGSDRVNNPGDVDILGKFSSEVTETGALIIKVKDEEARTIGEAVIYPIAADKDADGNDDFTGKPMTDPEVMARDGKSIEVKTKAVSLGTKVFVTPKTVIAQSLAVTETNIESGFKAEVSTPVTEPVKFDWMIVEEK